VHWATKHKFLKKDDEPHVWAPAKGGARQRVLTPEEARKLLENAVSPHIQLFIILALSTGARHTAILDLTWNRIDFEKGVIDYEESVEANPMSRSYKKGRAQVPMNNLARAALERAYAGRLTDYVVEWSGKRLHDVREGFALAVERAGLPGKVTPHTLRHTVTTWARERGIDKSRVANLLGHADERTQDLVYFHPEATTYLGEAVRTIEGALGDKYALPELQPKGVKPSARIREKRNRMSQRDK
jgi:integrase